MVGSLTGRGLGAGSGLDRGLQTELVWGVNGDWVVGWVGASKGTELKAGWGLNADWNGGWVGV